MTVTLEDRQTPCADAPEVFLDEALMVEQAVGEYSTDDWQSIVAKRRAAHRQCAGCPILMDCLYRAVVEVDVSGYVACTTESERRRMRSELGIEVQQPATGAFGAPRVGAGPVDHEAVVAARHAYPHDTCHQLADRLGCSTSTIKRHLRRARESAATEKVVKRRVPTLDEVLDCFDSLESSQVA